MSFSETVEKLDREIGATVERALGTFRRELAERLRAGNEQILRAIEEIKPELPSRLLADEHVAPIAQQATGTARQSTFVELRDAVTAIDAARSQAAILTALLAGGRRFASRTAILLTRGGQIHGWGAQGFGDGEQAVRGLTLDPGNEGAWGHLARGEGAVRLSAGDCADLCSRLESPLPHDGVLVPLVLRDQLAAALYADRLDNADLALEGLQTLAYVASLAIESLPFRERAGTATLRLAEPGAEPAAEQAPAATSPAAAETALAAEPSAVHPEAVEATAERQPAPEPAAVGASVAPVSPVAHTQEMARPAEAESPAPAASAGAETVLLPRVAFAGEPSAAPAIAPTQPAGLPADLEEDTQAGGPRPVAAGGSAAREEPRAPASPSIVNPEVRPPSDVDGPGWAFATARVNVAADDEALHEEARRLARLLVSEIKLYNEEQVEQGRRNRDLYERLKEDIDRSRQMYEERVEPRVLRSTDYFYQELVRILAAGDSKALGI